jgi:cysteine-rich repeat protein
MTSLASSSLPAFALVAVCVACVGPPPVGFEPVPVPNPGPFGDLVVERLELSKSQQPQSIAHRVHQLDDTQLDGDVTWESCEGVELALADVCGEMYSSGEVGTCSYQATFFYANDVPRCAVRFSSASSWEAPIHDLFVLDFAGTPTTGPAPTCGDGVLDALEMCDDGNHEMWDGCDANCQIEEFNGCETVIEHEYEAAGLAFVDRDGWDGPRSHLMVNDGAKIAPVTLGSCEDALVVGQDVCDRLSVEMPFINYCAPAVEYTEDDDGPACAVRLTAWFGQRDPSAGVFTTSLPGVLAFTIR